MLLEKESDVSTVGWRRAAGPSGKCWVADMGYAKLRVRPAKLPRSGMFVGYINNQRVGYWSSVESAKTQVARLALLHRSEFDF